MAASDKGIRQYVKFVYSYYCKGKYRQYVGVFEKNLLKKGK